MFTSVWRPPATGRYVSEPTTLSGKLMKSKRFAGVTGQFWVSQNAMGAKFGSSVQGGAPWRVSIIRAAACHSSKKLIQPGIIMRERGPNCSNKIKEKSEKIRDIFMASEFLCTAPCAKIPSHIFNTLGRILSQVISGYSPNSVFLHLWSNCLDA